MKSRGIFSCLCHSLDSMEEETRSLCGFLGRICGGGRRKETCSSCKKSPCEMPGPDDFRCEKCEKNE